MILLNVRTPKIYGLIEPSEVLRYVGKTVLPLKVRLQDHLSEARRGAKSHRANWIRSLLARGEAPQIIWLDEIENEPESYALEAAYIEFYKERGLNLVNGTPGGDCGPVMPGSEHPMFGKTHTAKARAAISAAQIGKPKAPRSPEHCANIGKANKGRKVSTHLRARQSKTMTGVRRGPYRPGARKHCGPPKSNTSGYIGVYPHGPSWRAMIKKTRLGVFDTPEEAARARDAAARTLWGNDCYLNFP